MATMDIIKLAGGEPANFLDVGGGASVDRVAAAFRVMMSDPHVKVVLINIFGGIVRCDRVASGIIQAMQTVEVNVPVIVRLDGTNADEARKMLLDSPLAFAVARTLEEAAQKVTDAIASIEGASGKTGAKKKKKAAVMSLAMASASMSIPPKKKDDDDDDDLDDVEDDDDDDDDDDKDDVDVDDPEKEKEEAEAEIEIDEDDLEDIDYDDLDVDVDEEDDDVVI
ncbi:MAG: hypothetical protein H7X80_08945, partial [bacterium]|nr:hypothetical protein [Candidatus Kapabacteria bacterium]